MNGGEALVETLVSRGVDTMLFVAGGTFVTVLEALSRRGDAVRAIPMRLESSAAFAADAYAAIRKHPACVLVSRGPGATNAAIGVHTAMQASRPLVLVISDIPRALKQREAFQEIDYRSMYASMTKAVLEVNALERVAPMAARAVDLAVSGRPGPVVLVVPKDVLDGPEDADAIAPRAARAPRAGVDADGAADAAALLAAADRPLVIAGEMVAFERAHEALVRFADATGAAVMTAYRQQDAFPNDHPAWLGQLAIDRTPHQERILGECDLIVAAGARLDSITTADYTMLREHHRLVMIYPDADAIAQWRPDVALIAATGAALDEVRRRCPGPPPDDRLRWRDDGHAEELAFSVPGQGSARGAVDMAEVIEAFRARVSDTSVMVSDAGTFARWIQRYYRYTRPDTGIGPVSGAMGYGVPGGIGAAMARPGEPIFVWVGDGGFLMTGHEVATIVQERLPVKIIVCDNGAWGSILVHQHKRFPGWEFGVRLRSPDFTALGDGYGVPAFSVRRSREFPDALDRALASDGPALIHLHLDVRDVSPFVRVSG